MMPKPRLVSDVHVFNYPGREVIPFGLSGQKINACPVAYGRNGGIWCSGLVVTWRGLDLDLNPITSKGELSYNSTLSIPAEAVPALIDALIRSVALKGAPYVPEQLRNPSSALEAPNAS